VFSSIQGEGLLAGFQQVFVRFRGCDLSCLYCDTPEARNLDGLCRVEMEPGGECEEPGNPLSVPDVARFVRRLAEAGPPATEGLHHSIALTGGEPLLYPEFIAELCAELHPLNLPIMLETNGQRPDDLRKVIGAIDCIAADFKLDSTMAEPVDAEARLEFLRLAQHCRTFIKIVLTDAVTAEELSEACGVIASVDQACPVFLQPVTPVAEGIRPPAGRDLLKLRACAVRHLRDVRVVPQIHRLLGVP
jgi:organic radical activating enzyme